MQRPSRAPNSLLFFLASATALVATAACVPPRALDPRAEGPDVAVDAGSMLDATRSAATDAVESMATSYPPPRPTKRAAEANDAHAWAPGEYEAEIRAALPDGAVFDVERIHRVSWSARPPDEAGPIITYTLGSALSVAVIAMRPPRLRWDLLRDGPADLTPHEVWPLTIRRGGPAVAVRTADGAYLLRIEIGEAPRVVDRLALPEGTAVRRFETSTPLLSARDLTGDGLDDVVLYLPADMHEPEAWPPVLALYARRTNGAADLVAAPSRGSMLIDIDHDGRLELVEPDGTGEGASGWTVRRWDGAAFAPAERIARDPAPTPVELTDGALPPLPGALTFQRRGEGMIWRWSREGGVLAAAWRAGPGDEGLRGQRLSGDGRYALLAHERSELNSGYVRPVDLVRINVDTGEATALTTHGSLRGFAISDDGRRVVYIGLGVGPDGRPLPPATPDPDAGAGESGTVFMVDADDPSRAVAVGTCAAKAYVESYRTVDCLGDVALTADGTRVAWADGHGVWVANVPGGAPRLTLTHDILVREGPGSSVYRPDWWSPDGRSLAIIVAGWEGSERALLDVESGRVTVIPETSEWVESQAELAWRPDGGGLLIARANGGEALGFAMVDDPGHPSSLWDALPKEAWESVSYEAIGPAIAPDGSLRFGLRHGDPAAWPGDGVYRAAADGSGLVRLAAARLLTPNGDPDDPWNVYSTLEWSPGGAAFLLRAPEGPGPRVLVGLADGTGLWDASAVMGDVAWAGWSR